MSDNNDPFAEDTAKYDAMKAEMDREDGIEPEGPGPIERGAETYDPDRHSGAPPLVHEEPEPPADDPVANFERYIAGLAGEGEQHEQPAQHAHDNGNAAVLLNYLQQDEQAMRAEYSDYDDACQHLEDGRRQELERAIPAGTQGELLARSYGVQGRAALIDAVIQRDRQMVLDHAIQTGTTPAKLYYGLAKDRGYRSPVGMGRTERKAFVDKLTSASGDDFDKLWEKYERMERGR